MRIPRIYQDTFLSVGDTVTLDAQATVHVARVLRLKQDDAVILFNGRGGEYQGRITSLEKRNTVIVLTSFVESDAESPLHITLAQGISRGERMDYTVQKSVELGIARITPLLTSRTSVNLQGERKQRRQQHWQTIVNHACEQCGRNTLPPVDEIQTFASYLQQAPEQDAARLVLYHKSEQSIATITPQSSAFEILIGPEGGLSEAEIELAIHNGFTPVRMGPRVMRTETAALAALSILQSQWGDLRR
jgi:16S rRNA (uracil1498-N3)-methyltransferase